MKTLLIVLSILTITVLVTPAVLAQVTTEPNIREKLIETRTAAGVEERTLEETVGTVIKWIIGFVGVVLVALFVYGGVVYATSAGNEERIETGKKVMVYAIVGIVIIAFAFVLVDYIIRALFPEAGGP